MKAFQLLLAGGAIIFGTILLVTSVHVAHGMVLSRTDEADFIGVGGMWAVFFALMSILSALGRR